MAETTLDETSSEYRRNELMTEHKKRTKPVEPPTEENAVPPEAGEEQAMDGIDKFGAGAVFGSG